MAQSPRAHLPCCPSKKEFTQSHHRLLGNRIREQGGTQSTGARKEGGESLLRYG
jgi:hypothetical protein